MEVIVGFIVLAILFAIFKKVWPFLLLGGIGYSIYLWPFPVISFLVALTALAVVANHFEKDKKKELLSIVKTRNIIDLEEIVEMSKKSRGDVIRSLDLLEKEGEVKKDIVKEKVLYKSKDYMNTESVQEINLD